MRLIIVLPPQGWCEDELGYSGKALETRNSAEDKVSQPKPLVIICFILQMLQPMITLGSSAQTEFTVHLNTFLSVLGFFCCFCFFTIDKLKPLISFNP